MKTKIALSMLVILFVIAASLGATLAWFTAEDTLVNEFTAGTVLIDVSEESVTKHGDDVVGELDNVNPGDCYEKEIKIENEGTKGILIRLSLEEEWVYSEGEDSWKEWIVDNWDSLYPGFSEGLKGRYEEDEDLSGWEEGQWTEFINKMAEITVDLDVDGWGTATDDDGVVWYYMSGDDAIEEGSHITVYIEVCFPGAEMTNEFQKIGYNLTTRVEAIQASNNASGDAWGVNSTYQPEEEISANWNGWVPADLD